MVVANLTRYVSAGTIGHMLAILNVNGAGTGIIQRLNDNGTGTDYQGTLMAILELSATDYVEVTIQYTCTVVATVISLGSNYHNIQISRIS
jgi:hypothetical protein